MSNAATTALTSLLTRAACCPYTTLALRIARMVLTGADA